MHFLFDFADQNASPEAETNDQTLGLGGLDLGFQVKGLRFRVLGFRVFGFLGLGFRVSGL